MASSGANTPPAGVDDTFISTEQEPLLQSPNLEPIHLTDTPEPSSIPTTAEALRRIFQDTSLSAEEQINFAESILAIVRAQPGDSRIYDLEGGDAEDFAASDALSYDDRFDEIRFAWMEKMLADNKTDSSSDSDSGSVQQMTQKIESTVTNIKGNEGETCIKNSQGEQATNDNDQQDEDIESNPSISDFSISSSDPDHFMVWEQLEIQAEIAWFQTLGREILPEHFALFKRCISERIHNCSEEEKTNLKKLLSNKQITWLTAPVPEDSGIQMPEKEQVWVVIWSVMKFARLLLRSGGGAVKDNAHITEYVTIMQAAGWLVGTDPFEYINQAQRGGPEVYMSVEGWILSKDSWAEETMGRLGGSFDEVSGHIGAIKEAGESKGDGGDTAMKEELVAGIIEEALMNTTRNVGRWSRYIEKKWLQAGGKPAGAKRGPAGATQGN